VRPIPTVPCLGLIHEFEKGPDGTFAPKAYKDPVGVWTIGWGHALPGPVDWTWTEGQADQQALLDLADAAEGVCDALTEIIADGLREGQYAALIDFAFNVGVGNFRNSTLCRLIKSGNMVLAPGEFGKWVYGHEGGKPVVLPGLVRRRSAEVAVWNAPV
jgi:lysozyme